MSMLYTAASTLGRSTKRRILLFVDIILVPPALLAAMMLQSGDGVLSGYTVSSLRHSRAMRSA